MVMQPPTVATPEDLLRLVTSLHNQQPRYMQTVALTIDPYIDDANTAFWYRTLFDLDTSVGQQEDMLGEWVGITRYITAPLKVFFSFDDKPVGFDFGKWKTPYEVAEQIVRLDDEHYRILLRARIMANYWDGTIPGAYKAWDLLFKDTGWQVLIQDGMLAQPRLFTFDDPATGIFGFDHAIWAEKLELQNIYFTIDTNDLDLSLDKGMWYSASNAYYKQHPLVHSNMHIIQAIIGRPVDAVIASLFAGGYMGLHSAGVGCDYVIQNQSPNNDNGVGLPLFALDIETNTNVNDCFVTFDKPTQGFDQVPIFYPGALCAEGGPWPPIPPAPPYFTLDSTDPLLGFDSGEFLPAGDINSTPWYPPPYDPDMPIPSTGVEYPPYALAGFDLGAWAYQLHKDDYLEIALAA